MQVVGWQEDLFKFLALAEALSSVFKTAAFNHSAIPPKSILPL
jgi:hypothetical protein